MLARQSLRVIAVQFQVDGVFSRQFLDDLLYVAHLLGALSAGHCRIVAMAPGAVPITEEFRFEADHHPEVFRNPLQQVTRDP